MYHQKYHLFTTKINRKQKQNKDDKFTTTSGIVNLHPTKGTHCVMFYDKFYFDSYGCSRPVNIMKQINKTPNKNET